MSALPLSVRKQYWRSLIRQEVIPNPCLYPHIVEELRAALRDALREIPETPCRVRIPCWEHTPCEGRKTPDGRRKTLSGAAC